MISHEYRCIFIHIPKCAGTSIESALGHLTTHKGRHGQDHRSLRMIEQPWIKPKSFSSIDNLADSCRRFKHQYLQQHLNPNNAITLTKSQYQEYFKFTVVRNPWARAVSCYKNIMRDEVHLKELRIQSDLSFTAFLRKFSGKGMLRPQTYWIKSFDGSIPMDFICRFENLAEDTKTAFSKLGLDDVTLPHKIKGAKDDFREYFDDEANSLILKNFKEEISLFDYSFDVPSSQSTPSPIEKKLAEV